MAATCELASENTDSSALASEPISSIRRWLFTKLKGEADGTCLVETKQDHVDNALPKIVISKGSPAVSRPSPLLQSWLQYDEMTDETPRLNRRSKYALQASPESARSISSGCSVYTFPGVTSPNIILKHSKSVPSTPMVSKGQAKINKKRPGSFAPRKPPSLVLNKAQSSSLRIKSTSMLISTGNRSQSDTDSPSDKLASSNCTITSSFDFQMLPGRRPDDFTGSGIHLFGHQLDGHSNKNIPLRRTSSCKMSSEREAPEIQQLSKSKSNIDVQKRASCRKKRSRRDRYKSSISLTRTWSVNLEPFRIIRHSASIPRKMSLNENAFSRASCRRRSSLLRSCMRGSSSLDAEDPDKVDSMVDLEEQIQSPQITRRAHFSTYDPLNTFKSTFESDSINVPSIYGQIKLMFQYLNEKEELQVTLLKGANIGSTQEGKLGIFATMCLMPGKRNKKATDGRHNTRDPVFYELFCFKTTLSAVMDTELRVKFYNRPGIFCKTVPVGECLIKMYDYDMTASNVIWQNLKQCHGQRDVYDEFDFGSFEKDVRQTSRPSLFCGLVPRPKSRSRATRKFQLQ